jgi:Tfp pilus assembly PilM family ATPase
MPRYAWGIDIGDGTLKAVRLKAEGRALHVVEVVEIPYLDPFLKKKSPPASIDRRAIAALLQFGSTTKISDTDRVAVGFPSFHAVEGVVEMPRVEEHQRDRMIQFEVSDMVEIPLRDLAIRHQHHRFRSEDIEQVLIHAVRKRELDAFFHYLGESGIPYDRIISSSAALVDMARLCISLNNKYLIVSPGFNATVIVALSGTDFWTRTLPLGLPVAPGEAMEVAREKVVELCGILKREIGAFIGRILGGKDFNAIKILVSGEGARVPAFINALDAILPEPVEVLRPATRLAALEQRDGMPPESVVHSMGKAIGLALGAVDETRTACSLVDSQTRRRALRLLPLLSWLSALVLLMVLGMAWLERDRSDRLESIESSMAGLPPSPRAGDMRNLMHKIADHNAGMELLLEAHKARRRLASLSGLLSLFEEESSRGTFGDYHMTDLVMDFGPANTIKSVAATRLSDAELVKIELNAMFQNIAVALKVEGPLPSGEETPPEGLAPLIFYRVEGVFRKR